jgi:uncharacterized integral membrane protein
MRFRTVVSIVVILTIAVFVGINWKVFAAPASFYILVGRVDMPLGLVMIALLVLIMLVVAIYVGMWQGSLLRDYRQQSKELHTQRTLADDAEASRFTALTTLLREEMSKQDARFQAAVDALRGEVRDTEHSLAATLAELDDRLVRGRLPPL